MGVSYASYGAGFDRSSGQLWTSVIGQGNLHPAVSTTSNDTFQVVGLPPGQPLSFNAAFAVAIYKQRVCNPPVLPGYPGTNCTISEASASISEVGGSSSSSGSATGNLMLSIPIVRRAYEPFVLSLYGAASAGGHSDWVYGSVSGTLRFTEMLPGASVVSCAGFIGQVVVPTEVSFVSATVEGGAARIEWYAPAGGVGVAVVERCEAGSEWLPVADIIPSGTGRLLYEDRAVRLGVRYGYRLRITDGQVERTLGEAWVQIPPAAGLGLYPLAPNPATGPLRARFSLASSRPARLELFDLAGRRLLDREVGALGRGPHEIDLDGTGALPSGIFLLRLSQDGHQVTRRASTVR